MSGSFGVGALSWTCDRCGFTYRNSSRLALSLSVSSHKTWCWTSPRTPDKELTR